MERGEVFMKQVINNHKRVDAKIRMPVLRLEIDYELATLFEAMQGSDKKKMTECLRKLEVLRQEMMRLKV